MPVLIAEPLDLGITFALIFHETAVEIQLDELIKVLPFAAPACPSPDGQTYLTVADGKPESLWDAETGELIRRYDGG